MARNFEKRGTVMAGKGRICARIIALGMAIVVSLTGCGEKSDMFTEYKVSVPVRIYIMYRNICRMMYVLYLLVESRIKTAL